MVLSLFVLLDARVRWCVTIRQIPTRHRIIIIFSNKRNICNKLILIKYYYVAYYYVQIVSALESR